jgi:hypothetical protein
LANTTLFSGAHENLFSASSSSAPIQSLGYNLSDDGSGIAFLNGSGDLPNVAALLSTTLHSNGGTHPTFTYALLPQSPALGKGDPGDGTSFADQRGIVTDPRSNIGAF